MNRLVLFCGGPAIYPGGVPKPLQVINGDRTLLELYFDTPFTADYSHITLLCESNYVASFQAVAERSRRAADIQVIETPNESTTLTKLSRYLQVPPSEHDPVTLTYPDIFYFGSLIARDQADWSGHVVLSLRALTSRFPRITKDPYSDHVRSISNHQSSVPANPVFMYGGHLLGTPAVLRPLLQEGLDGHDDVSPSLEFDIFSKFINASIVRSVQLTGLWLQADGPRDHAAVQAALALA